MPNLPNLKRCQCLRSLG